MFIFTGNIKDIDQKNAVFNQINRENLHHFYTDMFTNIYVNGELVDGFSEEEIANAIKNGCKVTAVTRNDEETRKIRKNERL